MARKQVRYDIYNDFYQLLGVPASANTEEIQHAFRQRAKEVHPDLNPDRLDWAKEQFQKLNEAQTLLLNESLRAIYDQQRRRYFPGDRYNFRDDWWNQPQPVGGAKKPPPPPPREAPPPRETPNVNLNEDPPSSAFRTPGVPPQTASPYTAVLRGLFYGPYRYVIVLIATVLCLNMAFIAYSILTTNRAVDARETEIAQSLRTQAVPIIFEKTIVAYILPTREPNKTVRPICPANPNVNILAPTNNFEINTDSFDVLGTANGEQFQSYMLEVISLVDLQLGKAPPLRVTLLHPVNTPVRNGFLGNVTIKNLMEGPYLLRLNVLTRNSMSTCEVLVIRKP